MPIWGWDFSTLDSCSRFFIERPPGVPFQKIQFGNERGGRSVLSRLPELRIARILALLRCLILRLSEGNYRLGSDPTRKRIKKIPKKTNSS